MIICEVETRCSNMQNFSLSFSACWKMQEKESRVLEEKFQSYPDKNHGKHNESNCQQHEDEIFITRIAASIFDDPINITSRILKSIAVSIPKSSIISARKVRRKSRDSNDFNGQTSEIFFFMFCFKYSLSVDLIYIYINTCK